LIFESGVTSIFLKSILLTTSTLPRFKGDAEPRFVLDLALALSKHYRVTILAPSDPQAALSEKIGGVEIIRYRYAPLRSWEKLAYPGAILPRLKRNRWLWLLVPLLFLGLYLALNKLLKSRQFDLVHCHWVIPQGAIQALGFSGSRAPPFIVTSHGGDLNAINDWFSRRIMKATLGRAAAITVVSKQLHQKVLAAGYDATIIPMGVDAERFCTSSTLEEMPNCREILFVGRLAEKKGVDVLIEAMARPELRNTNTRLLIVGDGPDKDSLMEFSQQLSVSDRVTFLGAIAHEELSKFYSRAYIFCAPSIVAKDGDMEGLPTVLLEASATGTPCVSTSVGGITDFIEDDVNGCIVEPGNSAALAESLARLLEDEALYQRQSLEARKKALEFDWPIIARRFRVIYEQHLDSLPATSQGDL
jgi:glycosyltransferase involved in cell wall biosynthesis